MIELKEDKNNKEVYLQIQNITKNIQVGIRKAYFYLGRDLLDFTRSKMKEKKSGRVYTKYYNSSSHKAKTGKWFVVYGRKRTFQYTASSPEEIPYSKSPATTSLLRKSLSFEVQGWEQLEYSANTPYAAALEDGTDKMEGRHYLQKSVEENLEIAATHFNEQISKRLNK